MKRWLVLLELALVATGCCAEEAELRREFDEVVESRNGCQTASDCEMVYPGCPFGCGVAVNREHAGAVRRKAEELVDEYESCNQECVYDCIALGEPMCVSGHCSAEPIE